MDRNQRAIDELGDAFEAFAEKHNRMTQENRERLEELEARANMSRKPAGDFDSAEHKAFDNFLRGKIGQDEYQAQIKSWTAADVDGSNAVPEHIYNDVQRQILQASPIRQNARVVMAQTGDFKFLVADDAQVASWGAEATSRAVTDTAYLNSVAPTGGEMWCTIQASNWFIEDASFDVAAFVQSEAIRQFAAAEAEAFCSGNGTNRPTGLTNGATSSTADQGASPERAFGTFQHIASGVAADLPGDRLASPQGDPLSPFIDCVAALRAGYLRNAAWYMNPSVRAELQKKRDANGRPLIESGWMGQPDRLLGYEIRIAEHLPSIAANALPIWFGDMSAGYLVADRVGMKVIVDQITTRGHTIWYVSRRVYGAPLDTAGLKCIKIATS